MWMRCRRSWAQAGVEEVVQVPQAGAHVLLLQDKLERQTNVISDPNKWSDPIT